MTQAFKQSRNWMTDEEYAWEYMRPVGREFGSPDYERLAALDALAEKAKSAADRAIAAIDTTLRSVDESNRRIQIMEKNKSNDPLYKF